MIKLIRPLCIVGIIAMLVLFVFITGINHNSPHENLKKEKSNKKSDLNTVDSCIIKNEPAKQMKSEIPAVILPW